MFRWIGGSWRVQRGCNAGERGLVALSDSPFCCTDEYLNSTALRIFVFDP
jgi:hypothetical protein